MSGVRNTLADLNDHLFAQIERLSDESLSAEELDKEISRSSAISSIAEKIIGSGNLTLKAAKLRDEAMDPSQVGARLFEK